MPTVGFPLMNPRFKAFVAGTDAPLAGGFVQFYLTGTTTPQDVFAEIACITPLTNPVQLDVNGEAEIYGNAVYDILVYDSTMVLQYTMLGISFAPADTSTTTTSQEWIAITGLPTYLSSTSFTVTGDQTSTFHVGRRVRAIITGGTIIYGGVVSSTYAVSTTVVISFDSGSLDSGLSNVKVGILDSRNTSIPILTPLPTTGAGNPAYTLTIQGGAPIAGCKFRAIINSTFTVIGGPATLNVNGTGDKSIKKFGTVALVSGDLQATEIHDFEYDGTNYQLLNPYTLASGQFVTNTIAGNSLIGIGTNNVVTANGTSATTNISLGTGTWLVEAWSRIDLGYDGFGFAYPVGTATLKINGTQVDTETQGPVQLCFLTMAGAQQVTLGSPTSVPVLLTIPGAWGSSAAGRTYIRAIKL